MDTNAGEKLWYIRILQYTAGMTCAAPIATDLNLSFSKALEISQNLHES